MSRWGRLAGTADWDDYSSGGYPRGLGAVIWSVLEFLVGAAVTGAKGVASQATRATRTWLTAC